MTEQVLAAETTHAREELGAQERRDEARRLYRESVEAEMPMTAKALGERFGRSARWGRERIAEVRAEVTGDGGMPPINGQPTPDTLDGSAAAEPTPNGSHQTDMEPVGMPAQTDGMPVAQGGMPAAVAGKVRTPGRRWAYVGAILGGGVSVAANVAHSYVPPVGAPAEWAPHAGAVIGAVFWPVFLFVAIEILARVVWPAGFRYVALRFLGLLPVALVAAVVSYRHMSGLLEFYGEDALTVAIGPLAIDGLMVMAASALLAGRARRGGER